MSLKDIIKKKTEEVIGKALPTLVETGEAFEKKIKEVEDYVGTKKEAYETMGAEEKNDLKKSLVGAGVTLIAPLYLAIPAGVYAYKKGKKFFGKEEEPEEKKD